jgi:hypothetical protein
VPRSPLMCTARPGTPLSAASRPKHGDAMSIVEQVLKSAGTERRAIGRTRINRDALLFFHGQADVFACCVRDATNSGAGIRLEGLNVLPTEFCLSFDRFRTVRRCRLIWREADFVGAAFEDTTIACQP